MRRKCSGLGRLIQLRPRNCRAMTGKTSQMQKLRSLHPTRKEEEFRPKQKRNRAQRVLASCPAWGHWRRPVWGTAWGHWRQSNVTREDIEREIFEHAKHLVHFSGLKKIPIHRSGHRSPFVEEGWRTYITRRNKKRKVLASFNMKKACNVLFGTDRVRTQDLGYQAERYDHCATRPVTRRNICPLSMSSA
jgi:hypothetical protein